ncbi:MAG: hypothetical protein Q4E75_02700 [bacterium]|nr:hypothetical protein [bacterium]
MGNEYKQFYDKFNNIYGYIENELKENGQISIDSMLINMTPNEVLTVLSNYAPISFNILKNNSEIRNILIGYLYKKKEYYESLSLSNEKLGLLLSKDGAGQVQHDKTESFYYSENDQEAYLNDILKRLIDCVNLYYDVYYNKDINVLLGDGTKLALQFLEENLLHILGITQSQVKGNAELKKVLNIPDDRYVGPMEILEKIIKDIQTNKDILCLQMKNRLKKVENQDNTSKIIETQLKPDTESELLPYDKIDLKTRAFINSGPYQDVSVISGVADNGYFIRSDKGKGRDNKEIQQVRISKSDFDTLKKEKVTIDTDSGKKIEIARGDYIFNGYTKKPGDIRRLRSSQVGTSKRIIPAADGSKKNNIGKFRAMFNGQSPIPIIGVENPGGGNGTTLYFSPEQQEQMFLSLYLDFGGPGGMNLYPYMEILKEFAENFKNELENQALAKTDKGIIIPNNSGLKK